MASASSRLLCLSLLGLGYVLPAAAQSSGASVRQRVNINTNWRFLRSEKNPDGLIYDYRTDTPSGNGTGPQVLKQYILPSGNDFIKDPARHHTRPAGNPGSNVPYLRNDYDDAEWEYLDLPHDAAIKGPFYVGDNVPVKGGMGRLPSQGVLWYRRTLNLPGIDKGKQIYLDIDGAQSYAMVWINGHLAGGWPYGYASFQLDITQYLNFDSNDLIAVRVDNPIDSSRWYPGAGIYRNVWITKTDPVHVGQWGTYVTTEDVSQVSATVHIAVQLENASNSTGHVEVATDIHELDSGSGKPGRKVAEIPRSTHSLTANGRQSVNQSAVVENPSLWGPAPSQKPNMYVAVTNLIKGNRTVDSYETRFGIRTFTYSGDQGLLVNGEKIRIQGVNQHHDLGAIGAAFNVRAAERQLEILRDMGVNAIRTSHNPPAPELLELTDQLGFLVMDEIFDSWQLKKTDNDFHLIFNDWHEPDARAFIRRDRNHPSIFVWSIGNEVGEQTTNQTGAAVAQTLHDIVHEEDPTRPVTASMNAAKPNMPFPRVLDLLSLNYQGEGIRDTPAYSNLPGIATSPLYPAFHSAFPEKLLLSTETAAALSTRGTYIFPVVNATSAPVNNTSGGNSTSLQVSDYSLYSADFGASPDKVFAAQDANPYVAGEFVWSGFDYLGEPTPYYSARSSYFGPIDLAGFPKDRFYLYQSRYRPDLRTAHILPHWTWPERVNKTTPVHVFSSGDEGELFLNGKSLGRKRKAAGQYRLRWDDVVYQPGQLHVVTYRNGTQWANASVMTAGAATQLRVTPDRANLTADGKDLSFLKVEVLDKDGNLVPRADNEITFSPDRIGQLIATDNGNPADFTVFPSNTRKAFSGLALGIIRTKEGVDGTMRVNVSAEGLKGVEVTLEVK